jgi:hypothetical protein
MTIRKKRAISIFTKAKEKSHKLKEQLTYAEKFCNYLLVRITHAVRALLTDDHAR